VIDGDRIAEVRPDRPPEGGTDLHVPFPDHYIVPGFIDVHVHGIEGTDALDGGTAIVTMAERLPRYGVTAFCPTSLACDPPSLRRMLSAVRSARTTRPPGGARVLPAHLESNFLNPEFKGAQPLNCLRLPPKAASRRSAVGAKADAGDWTGEDILKEIAAARSGVLPGMATAVRHGLNALAHMLSPTRMARRVQFLESVQLDRDLAGVRVPTLVVTGDAALDNIVPVRLTEEYVRMWPHAERATIARTGHIGLITRPDAFTAAVGSFVEAHAHTAARARAKERREGVPVDAKERRKAFR